MNNLIGPIVKHAWNDNMHSRHFFQFVINTTAYHLGLFSLHLILIGKELHDDGEDIFFSGGVLLLHIIYKNIVKLHGLQRLTVTS